MTHALLLLCLTQTPYADGSRLVAEGRFWQALDKLNQAIAQNPGDPRAYVARGSAHMGVNRNSAAIADYAYALQLDPNLALAAYGLGRAYFAVGQVDAAQEWYRKYQTMPGADLKLAPVGGVQAPPQQYGTPPPPSYTGTKQATPVPPGAAGSGLIYVFRNQPVATAVRVSLYVDGELMGELPNARYAELNVPQGRHVVQARGVIAESSLTVTVGPGSQHLALRLKEMLKDGKWSPDSEVPELEAVSATHGMDALRGLQKAFSKTSTAAAVPPPTR